MDFQGAPTTVTMVRYDNVPPDNELLPAPIGYSNMAYASLEVSFHQLGFADYQLPGQTGRIDIYHTESISPCHSGNTMTFVVPPMIDCTFVPSFHASSAQAFVEPVMPMPLPLPLPLLLPKSTQIQPELVIKTNTLRVGNAEAVSAFHDGHLQLFEQRGCIILARILIRIISPTKKKLYPYAKGDSASLPWWPQRFGEGEDEKIPHVDPCYIPKTLRICLLIHLLRLVVEPPYRQHPEIQQVNLDIATLEAIIIEIISMWFQEDPRNAVKRLILEEIFHVAKAEASFKAGQINNRSVIHVWPAKTLRLKYRKRSTVYDPTANDFDLELPPNMSDLAPDPQFAAVRLSGSVPEVPLEAPPCPTQAGYGIPALADNAVTLPPLRLPMDMIQLPADVMPELYVDQSGGPMQYGYAADGEQQHPGMIYTPVGFSQCVMLGRMCMGSFLPG
ncbi:hypothetical protein QBC36DRAFT_386802 [Triangularia setosa]|uniref:Subtelomeric hrmA-associated cluster protein AFUB-079030/YDR124W-like helical bundle domain-containing protein n=1 Tax=Triangularia setosa TaxID=2587417 RepID=A0AAN7A8K0_9PEZI|nr:hypothetical protein QBC36DRAFT_386802 [Podospora setosa]